MQRRTSVTRSSGRRADGTDDAALADLGLRIRARRRALDLTLRELSERTGTSVPFLSQVENGVGTPSLTTLFSLARVLGTPPEVLLAGPERDEVALVRRDDGRRYFVTDAPTSAQRRQITGADESFSASEYVVGPGDDLGGYFSSQGREVLHVLAGQLAIDLLTADGTVTHELGVGDSLVYSTTTEHRWRHVGPEATRFLHIVAPA